MPTAAVQLLPTEAPPSAIQAEQENRVRRRTLAALVSKYTSPAGNQMSLIYGVVLATVLYLAWGVRARGYLSAHEGIGYALGIAGGAMIALLLLYPLIRRLKIIRGLGPVRRFRIRMLFATLGPAVLLLHANFKIGVLNSAVALFAMLAVAASGIVGRCFYSRIHVGPHGGKTEVREILADMDTLERALVGGLGRAPAIEAELRRLEEPMLRPYRNVIAGFARSRRLKRETRRSRKVILSDARRVIARQARDHGWSRRDRLARQRDLRRHLEAYLAALTKAVQFAFYERLFSFWRFLHLPLCYFLVLAAVGHVVAAHLY